MCCVQKYQCPETFTLVDAIVAARRHRWQVRSFMSPILSLGRASVLLAALGSVALVEVDTASCE
jgi:hypothetical protein